jgi:hypothetical protein
MKKIYVLVASLVILMGTAIASGKQIPVDISAEANATWCGTPSGIINCSTYPTGSHTWDGIGFQIPTTNNAWFAEVAASCGSCQASVTIPVSVSGVKTVYTLMNTQWGSASKGLLSITFTATDESSFTYDLTGGHDIRDYNNDSFTDSIDCSLPNGEGNKGTVSAWKNGEGQRLDMQIFELPKSFSSKTLASVTITDNGASNVQRSFIAAMTISTCSP